MRDHMKMFRMLLPMALIAFGLMTATAGNAQSPPQQPPLPPRNINLPQLNLPPGAVVRVPVRRVATDASLPGLMAFILDRHTEPVVIIDDAFLGFGNDDLWDGQRITIQPVPAATRPPTTPGRRQRRARVTR